MDVVYLRGIVVIIADRVLPETAFPDAALAATYPHRRARSGVRHAIDEQRLHRVPVSRCSADGPQHHKSIDVEGRARMNGADRLAQGSDFLDQQATAAVERVHREELLPFRNAVTAASGHA